jgi:multidrug resistance efflux pump
VAAAEAGLARTTALKDAAEIADDAFQEGMEALAEAKEELEKIPEPYRPTLPGMQLDVHLIPNAYWKSWVGVNMAQAGMDGARAALSNLYAIRNNPQELNCQVDAAETQYRVAEAAVQMAQAQLDALRAGATEEEIAAVEAQVEQAQAALDALMVYRDKLTIVAPVGGLVLERCIHEGELAAPGATLLTLGDLDEVTLTIYVPEDRLGQVHVGQQVEVRVDSFPERTFAGTVVAIAHEAEFTPRNVQTQEERVNMVFAVDVSIPNPDHALKPGLPADATEQ